MRSDGSLICLTGTALLRAVVQPQYLMRDGRNSFRPHLRRCAQLEGCSINGTPGSGRPPFAGSRHTGGAACEADDALVGTSPADGNTSVGASPGGFYASSYPTASTIYCADDSTWHELSRAYLVHFATFNQAKARFPGYHLHQPC